MAFRPASRLGVSVRRWAWRLLLLLGGTAFAPLQAEELTFRTGETVVLPTRLDGDRVQVEAPWNRTYTFARGDFRRIGGAPWPVTAWPAREAAARADGPASMSQAARWALDHGLVGQARMLLRQSLEADPDQAETARLVAGLDRLEPPLPAVDLDVIRAHLPGRFQVLEGAHVVLLHQHTTAEAQHRLDLLETVYAAFLIEFTRLELEPVPPQQKLVSVWFADRLDYLAYLRQQGATAHLTTRGYCHPTRLLSLSYDARSDLEYRRRRAEFDGLRSRLDARSDAEAVPSARTDLDRRELTLELQRLRLDHGTAAHELVHQLVRATRLEPRPGAFPIWLHEGLAMQFEAIEGDRWAGLAEPPPDRLARAQSRKFRPALVPLLQDQGLQAGYQAEAYAQAWSLVHSLRIETPEAFVALIDSLRRSAVDSDPGTVALESLRASFGPRLQPLEQQWARAIAETRRPR